VRVLIVQQSIRSPSARDCAAPMLPAECHNTSGTLYFHTLSGVLSVTCKQQGDSSMLQMSLPAAAAVDQLPRALVPTSSSSVGSSSDLAVLLGNDSKLLHLLTATLQGLRKGALHRPDAEIPREGAAGDASSSSSSSPGELVDWLLTVVQHVGFASSLKYMLVVLKAGVGKAGLQLIRPDYRAMEAAASAQHITGIIITAQPAAGEPRWPWWWLTAGHCCRSSR